MKEYRPIETEPLVAAEPVVAYGKHDAFPQSRNVPVEPCAFTLDEMKQELALSEADYRAGRVHTVAELRKRHAL